MKKTAIGLRKEEAYFHFIEATNVQCIRGFNAFKWSLLLFVVDISLIYVDKILESIQPFGAIVAIVLTYLRYLEFDTILQGAAPMFTDVIPGKDDDGDVDVDVDVDVDADVE
jgi:hypothetical protein